MNEAYNDIFKDTVKKANPVPVSRDCYVSAEAGIMNKAGVEIGDESFGDPLDHFKYANLIQLHDGKLRVAMDLVHPEEGIRSYLPHLRKLKSDLEKEDCFSKCSLIYNADYDDVLLTLEGKSDMVKEVKSMMAFEKKFNEEYIGAIEKFLQSDVPTYRISRYCVKVVKLLKVFSYDAELKLTAVDNSDKMGEKGINFDSFKIPEGFETENLTTMIMVDRECVLDKIFGRFFEE